MPKQHGVKHTTHIFQGTSNVTLMKGIGRNQLGSSTPGSRFRSSLGKSNGVKRAIKHGKSRKDRRAKLSKCASRLAKHGARLRWGKNYRRVEKSNN